VASLSWDAQQILLVHLLHITFRHVVSRVLVTCLSPDTVCASHSGRCLLIELQMEAFEGKCFISSFRTFMYVLDSVFFSCSS
jgi:hypothetical protein